MVYLFQGVNLIEEGGLYSACFLQMKTNKQKSLFVLIFIDITLSLDISPTPVEICWEHTCMISLPPLLVCVL